MSWFLEALKKYAVFSGRSRRKEYWYFVLFNLLIAIVLSIIDVILGTFSASANIGLLSGIWAIAMIIPSLAVSIRRLHDIDRTGWWVLISFVPLIGTIVLFIFAILDGTPGDNRFGPSPKAIVA